MQKGNISVQTENIFPIIKKFLYSDHEIFLRELVANAVDASSKLLTLANRGEVAGKVDNPRIQIIANPEAKTLTIKDQGIGMTEEEVMKYLNQVAFSSAKEFLEQYQDEASIIGHFGLGFYSAFMVAKKVEVRTLSYKEGAKAVQWSCEGDPEYTLEDIEKTDRGTEVILYLNDEDDEFAQDARIQGLLDKYCKFLPIEIQFGSREEQIELPKENEEDEPTYETKTVPNIINNPRPAWKKQPNELSEEEYKAFYNELYPTSEPPLFWVHLNIDYPFDLTGILYFPKLGNQMEVQRNKIQLYSNQVYVTDEVKEIVPEFLTLLHGVIDSPDIPLNVSRSYLQSDRNVKKITDYITKKVADKLQEIFRKERQTFEEKWENMNIFIKYGYISEDKFAKKASKFMLLQNTEGKLATLEEYKEQIKEQQTDKNGQLIYLYANQVEAQDAYIQTAKQAGYDVLQFDSVIDTHFIQKLEQELENTRFVRVDSDSVDKLIQKDEEQESILNEEQSKEVEEIFRTAVSNSQVNIQLEALAPDSFPLMITRPEFMRRMQEMSMLQGGNNNMPEFFNLVVNSNHPLISSILESKDADKAKQLYQLAQLQQGMLKGADLTQFVQQALSWMNK
ncbi:molecular chaperone of HSP90 family [Saprospira grandis DSM 2844]|uniref:Chaperone protein HtpG n=1 Tax=Saprospira grandis DSM 2844 TaxID=694433 RepID=J1I5N4_9BACT|nr:molecular chaperone HtpG [Saprospira grandis]EJF54090.1 molecular chaperone of HSP90 family [Saprospira grandis DSM 2844]